MSRLRTGAFVALLCLIALPAAACPFRPGETVESAGAAAAIASLPEGVVRGWVQCPGERARPMVVWTLRIDAEADYVGVRDAPLFTALPQNPLVRVAGIGYGRDADFTMYMRADQAVDAKVLARSPDRRKPYWLFGTLCSKGVVDALDCRVGKQRMKARVDTRDSDGDGVLDVARHEVSILHGDRLQVLSFTVPHAPEPRRIIARWVEALDIAGFL